MLYLLNHSQLRHSHCSHFFAIILWTCCNKHYIIVTCVHRYDYFLMWNRSELLDQMESTLYTLLHIAKIAPIILKRTKYCSHDFLPSLWPFFPILLHYFPLLFIPCELVFSRVMSFCFLLLPPKIITSNAYKSLEGTINMLIQQDARQ